MRHLFDRLGEAERREFVQRARRRSFNAGDHVFWQGDPGDAIHLVMKGSFAASVSTALAQTVIVEVFHPKDVFGELALFGLEARRSATVTALERAETLSTDRRNFEEWKAQRPEIDALIIRALALRVREMSDQILESLYLPLDTRVARRILTLSQASSPQCVDGWVRIRQEDLAAYCGVTRTTANRVLGQMAVENLIELRRGRLRVQDLSALEKRAGAPSGLHIDASGPRGAAEGSR
jgi:CRP/FNR family transcriptional regulator, cyclic AMP receptor protein